MRTLECVRVLEGHVEAVLALTVMRGHLISGSYDTTVRFWRNNGTFDCVGKFEGHDDAVRVLTSSGEDAEKVYSGSYDGSIGFWSAPMAAGASTSGAAIAVRWRPSLSAKPQTDPPVRRDARRAYARVQECNNTENYKRRDYRNRLRLLTYAYRLKKTKSFRYHTH